MMWENEVKMVFRDYLECHGYSLTDDSVNELVEIYLDCQDWENDKLLTGNTEFEMVDWIKHTKEVERVSSQVDAIDMARIFIGMYMETAKEFRNGKELNKKTVDIAS